jgi:hypothetical protein
MVYHSVAEILNMITDTHGRLYERITGLRTEQEGFRPDAESWTIANITEHLGIVAGQFLRLTNKLLAQAEATGAPASPDLRASAVTLPPAATDLGEKFKAPESAFPSGQTRVAESVEKIQQAHEALLALRPRLEAADLSQATLPHFTFGTLNLYQWLMLIGVHEDRHIVQIEAVKAAPGFPA